jgi:hypothetical protein
MITYTQLGRYGRLGNQLFQYAVLRAIAARRRFRIVIPRDTGHRLFNFALRCSFAPAEALRRACRQRYIEPHYHFDARIFDAAEDDTDYQGYFQSERYFADIADTIRREFQFVDPGLDAYARLYLDQLRRPHPARAIVALHNRRGDNVPATENRLDSDGSNYLLDKGRYHPLLSTEYLDAARKQFGDAVFLVFSDRAEDIAWCREHIRGERHYYSEGHGELQDLALMRRCDHHIVANSSFSWWAAWLNPNPGKVVVAPQTLSPWFGPAMADLDLRDLLPAEWVKL